ncbi:MAG: phage portal protein [Acidobacteriota bacterium]
MSWFNPLTWFSRSPQASYSGDPLSDEKVLELLTRGLGVPTSSGVVVDEQNAMRVSTVYRCISLLAGTIASLPCEVYRVGGDGRSVMAPDHPAYWLLHDEPSPMMTANTFWKSFVWMACARGNGYGLIGRSALGAPTSISWVHSSRVSPRLSPDKTRLHYGVSIQGGDYRLFDQDDVLHYPFIGFDGLEGRSPLECAREAVGLSFAGQEFNSRFFSQGNASDLAMVFPGAVSKEQAELILETYRQNRTGLGNMRLPLIVEGGSDIKRLDFNANDSQLLPSRQFQVEDVCRFFGVPPHMVGHTSKTSSWGTGIEEQTLGFVKFTLRDLLKGIEQEVNRKIFRSGRFFCKFNLDALLRGDTKARTEFYKAALGGTQSPGFLSVNEVRDIEGGWAPVPGGEHDKPYVPQASGGTGVNNGGKEAGSSAQK